MIYVVLAIIASMALNAPLGMAIGFVLALIVALAQSHGTMRERIRQVLGMGYVRAITAFAIACAGLRRTGRLEDRRHRLAHCRVCDRSLENPRPACCQGPLGAAYSLRRSCSRLSHGLA